MMVCVFRAIGTRQKAFSERFWGGWEGDFEYGLSSQRMQQFMVDKNWLIVDQTAGVLVQCAL